jgi:dihydrofolate reductase
VPAKLIVSASISLDGVVQSPAQADEDRDGGFDQGGWILPFGDPGLDAAMAEPFSTAGSMLLGRRTYDILSAFWPSHPDEDGADHLNAMRKYVTTRHGVDADWHNTEVLVGDAASTVADLKARESRPILVQGSSDLHRTLAGAGLVDEYHLFVYPVILGGGKRLFASGMPASGPGLIRLRLLESTATGSGVVCSTYAVG